MLKKNKKITVVSPEGEKIKTQVVSSFYGTTFFEVNGELVSDKDGYKIILPNKK